MRLLGMFPQLEVAERNALMCEGLGFKTKIESADYHGQIMHWLWIEPLKWDAEKRLTKKTRS